MARQAQGIAESTHHCVSRASSADRRIRGMPSRGFEFRAQTQSEFELREAEKRALTLCSFSVPTNGRQRFWLFFSDCGTAAGGRHRVCGSAATSAENKTREHVPKRSYLLV